jgi:hypothetical protein
MIRLQRVTFLALHDYLGLTTELTSANDTLSSGLSPTTLRSDRRKTGRQRTSAQAKVILPSIRNSTDTLDHLDNDSSEKENLQSVRASRSVVDLSCASSSPVVTQENSMSATPNPTSETEHTDTKSAHERTNSNTNPTMKRSALYSGQRSMSVVESHRLKPDFEEAAARARVKNSLDNAFFERHKISYPNVFSNRISSSSVAHRRSSVSDVSRALVRCSTFDCKTILFSLAVVI